MAKVEIDPKDRSPYRLLRGGHTRFEGGQPTHYGIGANHNSLIMLTKDEAKELGDRVRPAPGEESTATVTTTGGTPKSKWAEISDKKVADVVALIEKSDDPADVQAILEYEAGDEGKQRKGVIDAASARLVELGV